MSNSSFGSFFFTKEQGIRTRKGDRREENLPVAGFLVICAPGLCPKRGKLCAAKISKSLSFRPKKRTDRAIALSVLSFLQKSRGFEPEQMDT
ncbi:hypothetical protein [Gemmiger sp. An50]|uniref:hypothetical protein n=1 Tax=Gemmiger sp. An50 TaxID=1965639 RepID=UPI0011227C32|nr:hypothetical protein [Gemmiger sp. An50]